MEILKHQSQIWDIFNKHQLEDKLFARQNTTFAFSIVIVREHIQ